MDQAVILAIKVPEPGDVELILDPENETIGLTEASVNHVYLVDPD